MDIVLQDHSKENITQTFDCEFLYEHPLYSLAAKRTQMKWLLIIPKRALTGNPTYAGQLHTAIFELVDFVQENGIGSHYNLAKIGNKHPNLHTHLVFRDENDEAWPDAIWCHEPLSSCTETASSLKKALAPFFNA